MTKVAGQAASYAPQRSGARLALGAALAVGGMMSASMSHAACGGAPVITCTGAFLSNVTLTDTPLDVVTGPGFSINSGAGAGLDLRGTDGLTYTDNNMSPITGSTFGITATNTSNLANISTSITTTGAVTGTSGDGINVSHNTFGSLSLSTAAVTGAINGILTNNLKLNSSTTITATDTVTTTAAGGAAISVDTIRDNEGISISVVDLNATNEGIDVKNGAEVNTITSTGHITAGGTGINFTGNYTNVGDVTINTVDVTAGGDGIDVSSTASNRVPGADMSVTSTGTVQAGGGFDGIRLINSFASDDITVNANNVSAGDSGVEVQNHSFHGGNTNVETTGTVTTTTGNGIDVSNTHADGGDITIRAVDVSANGTAIRARNAGNSNTSISATGDLHAAASSGVLARNTNTASGDLSVSVAAVTAQNVAIDVENWGTGTTSITATGALNAARLIIARNQNAAGGDMTVSVASVTATGIAIEVENNGTGSTVINATGRITADSTGINLSAEAGRTSVINLNAGSSVHVPAGIAIQTDNADTTLNIDAGAAIAGGVIMGDGSDTVFANGDISAVTVIDGGDDVDAGDGSIDRLDLNTDLTIEGSNLTNFETLNLGAVLTLRDASSLAVGDGTLMSGLSVLAGGRVNLATGNTTITGRVSNAGIISSQANAASGDALTIAGDFVGAGGTIAIDAALGGDGSSTDVVTVTGAASGTGTLSVNNIGGMGAQTTNGIDVVLLDPTATLSLNLEQPLIAGDFIYSLERDAATGNYRLVSTGGANQNSVGGVLPIIVLGLSRLDGFIERQNGRQQGGAEVARNQLQFDGGVSELTGVWGKVTGQFGSLTPRHSTTGTRSIDTTSYQTALGASFELLNGATGTLVGEVSGSFTQSSSRVAAPIGQRDVDSNVYGLGLAATWVDQRGFYLDAQMQLSQTSSEISDPTTGVNIAHNVRSDTLGLSLEVGVPFTGAGGITWVPNAQLSYTSVDVAGFTDNLGVEVPGNTQHSLRGRLGLTALRQLENGSIFGSANITHEFEDDTRVTIAGIDHSNRIDATSIGFAFGVQAITQSGLEVDGSVNFDTSLRNPGDSYSAQISLGVTHRF